MPRVSIVFADGERRSFDAPSDISILAAARAAGISLASDCEIGDCQTCKAQLKSGRVEIDELAFLTLDDEEIKSGAILTCVSLAKEDVEIVLPYLRSHLIPQKVYSLRISEVVPLSPTTIRLRGELPSNTGFSFYPGQYVSISIPGTDAVRSYSMASDPGRPNCLEFHIRLLASGKMSEFLRRPDIVGTALEMVGPKGAFYLRDGDSPILMLAGGTGLAPMVSMLRSIVGGGKAELPITLCFGVSRSDDLYYTEELHELTRVLPNLDLRLSVLEAAGGWDGNIGFVTELITPDDMAEDVRAYLCGPPPMIVAARKLLGAYGSREGAVFAEEFSPSG